MMSLALGISCVVFVPTTTLDYKKIDLFPRRIFESCTGVSALVQPMHNDDAPGMNLGFTRTSTSLWASQWDIHVQALQWPSA